jgi:exonuclease III
MKLLSWNCRGLGKPAAVRALKLLTQAHHPDIVFLSETKLLSSELSKKTNSFGNRLPNQFYVDCILSNSNRQSRLGCMRNVCDGIGPQNFEGLHLKFDTL